MQFVFFRPLTSIANFVTLTIQQANDGNNSVSGQDNDDPWAYFKSPSFVIAIGWPFIRIGHGRIGIAV